VPDESGVGGRGSGVMTRYAPADASGGRVAGGGGSFPCHLVTLPPIIPTPDGRGAYSSRPDDAIEMAKGEHS
jgi:hypothetical protein